ncbi:uncharacterized protein LOC143288519 [Babylonia areolata]|uniref:uncharacterized protein LOC143288519 n=1 Tax=Babylonia areolata TaxID=304850 RepID=UPI003FD30F85
MAVPHEVMFQNQLQFNLNVPLTTRNMTAHFHRPTPITIHRASAAPTVQGFPMAQLAHREIQGPGGAGHTTDNSAGADNNGFQFSALSQDRMKAAVQMAQRDLKNQKVKAQQEQNRTRSPSPVSRPQQKPVHGTRQWESYARSRAPKKVMNQGVRSRGKVGVKEHDKNTAPRSTASQTPPSSPPRQVFLNTKLSPGKDTRRSDSPPTRDTPSLTRVVHMPSDNIEKLQLEMEMCLQQIESVQKRALSEHSTDFLRRGLTGVRGHQNALRLVEEEGKDRRQVRASEQAHRALRTIYNLQQQVKEMERHALRLPRHSRATKKSQASQRLVMVNKGAVRLLHNFVAQLPHQDLHSGLPSHFADLADLVRQVTLLSAGAPLDGKAREATGHKSSSQLSPIETDVMAMLDQVEKLDRDWRRELTNKETAPAPTNQKPPFITNFRNTKPAFMKEQVDQPSLLSNQLHNERKAVLQESIKALLNAGRRKKAGRSKATHSARPYHTKLAPPPPPKGYSSRVPTRRPPPSRKGFLLPQKVRTQRAVAQQAAASQMATHFADPTITANLKASTMLHNPLVSSRSRSEPPSPGDRRKVNFIPPYAAGQSHHASYPGVGADRSRSFLRSISPPSRLSRSHSPRVRFSASQGHGKRSMNAPDLSDSERSQTPCFSSGDEMLTLSPAPSMESFPLRTKSHRSLSPGGRSRSHSGKRGSPRRSQRSRSPPAQRRQFFVADADAELVEDLFPESVRKAAAQNGGHLAKTGKGGGASLAPYMQDVERRVHSRLSSLVKNGHLAEGNRSGLEDIDLDRVADAILDEAIAEATGDVTRVERTAAAGEVAASYLDNPTLENILQALERMEKENERLRQKYSSVTFHDSVPRRRRQQKASQVFAEFKSDQPCDPPSFEVTNTRPPPPHAAGLPREFPEDLTQDPLIFTKAASDRRPQITFQQHGGGEGMQASSRLEPPAPSRPAQRSVPVALRPKTLLSMKQTVVERIVDGVERFEFYQRGLKQHLGRRRPFDLYESVADSVLKLCCAEVAQELEHINADMAENIYTSEFMSDTGLPLAPTALVEDFHTDGTAAQNLRDSAAAQRTVEAAVSKTVTSLMLPPDEPELSVVVSPRRVIDTEGGVSSPGRDTSLKHVYDATALYEASITADRPAPMVGDSEGRGGGGGGVGVREDDTHVEGEEDYDYDDDYTDISDEDEDESESPSP